MNCERFHEDLGELGTGRLSSTLGRALLEHADTCPECGDVLAMEDALGEFRSSSQEADVPDHLVDGMWDRLRPELGEDRRRRFGARLGATPTRRSLQVAAAAAIVALLVGGGYWLGQQGHSPVERVETPPKSGPGASVAASNGLTAGTLLQELAPIPASTTLISADQARAILSNSLPARRWLENSGSAIDLSDGVQAGELRQVLGSLSAETEVPIPPDAAMRALRRWIRRQA